MADKVVLKQTWSVCEEVKEVKRGFQTAQNALTHNVHIALLL